MTCFLYGGLEWTWFVSVEIGFYVVSGSGLPLFCVGDRNRFDIRVEIEVDLVFASVVELDVVSVYGMQLYFISV